MDEYEISDLIGRIGAECTPKGRKLLMQLLDQMLGGLNDIKDSVQDAIEPMTEFMVSDLMEDRKFASKRYQCRCDTECDCDISPKCNCTDCQYDTHDCTLSPEDGCSACTEYMNNKVKSCCPKHK